MWQICMAKVRNHCFRAKKSPNLPKVGVAKHKVGVAKLKVMAGDYIGFARVLKFGGGEGKCQTCVNLTPVKILKTHRI